MKKIFAFCFSLILILTSFCAAFAATEIFEVDSFTGEIIKSSTGYTSNLIQLPGSCVYDTSNKRYIYSTTANDNTDVFCNVYDGMVTADMVSIESDVATQLVVYKDGKTVDPQEYGRLTDPGTYIVRTVNADKEVFSFTIVGQKTGLVYSYMVPTVFNILSVKKDGEDVVYVGRTIDLSEEGHYDIRYKCQQTGVVYELNLDIDHTAPELEIRGVENGIARGPVSFGTLEEGSTLAVLRNDGEKVDYENPIKVAGDYTAVYTDEAGNESTYYFTVKVFLDGGAWVFVGLAASVVILAGGYMLYCRKNMRTR